MYLKDKNLFKEKVLDGKISFYWVAGFLSTIIHRHSSWLALIFEEKRCEWCTYVRCACE